jgi:SAM-dependent methyltransferase
MFQKLKQIRARPEPFSCYTARELWTDAHTSGRMLAYHLNENIDVSSRKAAFIRRSVAWIASRFAIGEDTHIADFGCGPGLYTAPLARCGAQVTGIDFSSRSIDHARQVAARDNLPVCYVNQDYLSYETDRRFDLVLMIMCDFCALSPAQRRILLDKFQRFLKPGGSVLIDVYALAAFNRKEEGATFGFNLLDGFWSAKRYFGFRHTFKYDQEKVTLDKYTIVEAARRRTVYNWLQFFSPEDLEREFSTAGFSVNEFYADVAGAAYNPQADEFAVIATRN